MDWTVKSRVEGSGGDGGGGAMVEVVNKRRRMERNIFLMPLVSSALLFDPLKIYFVYFGVSRRFKKRGGTKKNE